MNEQILFFVVFSSQVLLSSYFLPRQLLERVRHVVKNYPPERYPLLYPVSIDEAERAQRLYRNMNLFALAVGLGLIVIGFVAPSETAAVLDWNGGSAIGLYFVIQSAPWLVALSGGFTYFNLKRKPDARTRRTAELRRRSLFDYVSSALVGAAALTYVAFVVLVGYIRTFDFPWFGGYWNIVAMTAMNLFFAAVIARLVYGKQEDPYKSAEDRARDTELGIKTLLITSVFATVFVALNIGLGALEMRHLQPMFLSLYLQVISVISFRGARIDDVNFEVYREEPAATYQGAEKLPGVPRMGLTGHLPPRCP